MHTTVWPNIWLSLLAVKGYPDPKESEPAEAGFQTLAIVTVVARQTAELIEIFDTCFVARSNAELVRVF